MTSEAGRGAGWLKKVGGKTLRYSEKVFPVLLVRKHCHDFINVSDFEMVNVDQAKQEGMN